MIVVAGHICLDLIPMLGSDVDLVPGRLIEVGDMRVYLGGTVANVGIGLHKLGTTVRVVARAGRDMFSDFIHGEFRYYHIDSDISYYHKHETSYSIVLSPEGRDRTFLHYPGANDFFDSSCISSDTLLGMKHLHFGYPPLMKRIRENNGEELVEIFKLVKTKKKSTSLDMSLPDPKSPQGKIDWTVYLTNVLPYTDFFMPSEDELAFMLPGVTNGLEGLAQKCLDLGAGVVVIKRGANGLYARSTDAKRLSSIKLIGNADDWANKTLTQPIFPAKVVGTTGSGDATISGFLHGLVNGFPFQRCLAAGCAVGAMSTEDLGSVFSIKYWNEVEKRFGV